MCCSPCIYRIVLLLLFHNPCDTLAEWLRRRPAKPMGSARVGSNPTGVVLNKSAFVAVRAVVETIYASTEHMLLNMCMEAGICSANTKLARICICMPLRSRRCSDSEANATKVGMGCLDH